MFCRDAWDGEALSYGEYPPKGGFMNRVVCPVFFLMFLLPCIICNNALAVTIDLFSLMNHNSTLYTNGIYYSNANVVYLGDGAPIYADYTSYPAVETFSLPEAPVSGGSFEVSITWWGTEFKNNNFSINNSGPFVLPITYSNSTSTSTLTFTGLNSELFSTALNTLTFNLAKSGYNYEDMVINAFTLTYDGVGNSVPSPTPEPATMILFGAGLAGLAASRRRKKTC